MTTSDFSLPPNFFGHVLNDSCFIMIGTDPAGLILSWNRIAQATFGISSAAVLGKPIITIAPDDSQEEFQAAMDRAAAGEVPEEFEIYLGPENKQTILAVTISAVNDADDGALLGLAAWMRDITVRKGLEQQLLQVEKMASLGTLAAGVAHHFNNIIGGVATFVDFAEHSDNPEHTRRALQMTSQAAGRISHITQSLLTFAEKDLREFDLSDLTEVVLTFSHLVEKPLTEKGIHLILHLQPVSMLAVASSRIHQMLGNLLDNAESALPDGGTVTIDLHESDTRIMLEFSDTGYGIPEDHLEKIFEPFYTTRGADHGGDSANIGLGLSVVHGIVRELNGTIDVTSTPGKGTCFTITFPVVPIKKN